MKSLGYLAVLQIPAPMYALYVSVSKVPEDLADNAKIGAEIHSIGRVLDDQDGFPGPTQPHCDILPASIVNHDT